MNSNENLGQTDRKNSQADHTADNLNCFQASHHFSCPSGSCHDGRSPTSKSADRQTPSALGKKLTRTPKSKENGAQHARGMSRRQWRQVHPGSVAMALVASVNELQTACAGQKWRRKSTALRHMRQKQLPPPAVCIGISVNIWHGLPLIDEAF